MKNVKTEGVVRKRIGRSFVFVWKKCILQFEEIVDRVSYTFCSLLSLTFSFKKYMKEVMKERTCKCSISLSF